MVVKQEDRKLRRLEGEKTRRGEAEGAEIKKVRRSSLN
jgi:hypothetical protein